MFVDFEDIFNENPQSQFKIPQQYLKTINEKLPKGIKYVLDKNGNCVISSEGKELRIGGLKVILNQEQKKILGNEYKLNDVLEYSYNSQQAIQIEPVEEGCIVINNHKMKINELEYNPLNPVNIVAGKAYIYPPKFENNFVLKVGDGKYERILHMTRKPYNSVNVMRFESDENEPLILKYTLDKQKNEFKMKISFNLEYSKNVKDIVESVHIYNAFFDGRGYLENNLIKTKIDDKECKKYDEESALFWEKVLKIEEKLGIEFKISQEDIEYEKILEIEELYQSLILNNPFKDKNKINTISANWIFKEDVEIEDSINKPIFLQFDASYEFDFLGCKKKLPAFLMIFDSKLSKIEKNGNETTIFLEDIGVGKERYTSVMCFKNKEELEKNKEKIKQQIQIFKDAKKASEYLRK